MASQKKNDELGEETVASHGCVLILLLDITCEASCCFLGSFRFVVVDSQSEGDVLFGINTKRMVFSRRKALMSRH